MIAPSSRQIGFAGASVSVASSDPAALDWLAEVLSPGFDAAPSDAPGFALELDFDASLHAARRADGPLPGIGPVPCFTLPDGAATALPWRGPTPARMLFDPGFDVFYEIEAHPAVVRILARPGNRRARLPLLQIIREVGLAAACRRQALILRAAALVIDEQALLIAGPSGSGKTTLLAHLLRQPGARFMADDLVLLRRRSNALIAQGVPTLVTLHADTPRLLQEPFSRLVHDATMALLTPAERAALPTPTPTGDGRLILTPRQFANAAGVGSVAAAELVGIFLPEIDARSAGLALHRLAPQEALGRLTNSLFRIANGGAAQSVFASFGGGAPTYRSDLALLHELAVRVPTFVCTLGRDALTVAPGGDGFPVFAASGQVPAAKPSLPA